MILVDSSVWIDFFNGKNNQPVKTLEAKLENTVVLIGDLILIEVLQGFRAQKHYDAAKEALSELSFVELGGLEVAKQAVMNYRSLRRRGVTIRKTIDTVIASYCIMHDIPLLQNGRDFEPFAKLNLKLI